MKDEPEEEEKDHYKKPQSRLEQQNHHKIRPFLALRFKSKRWKYKEITTERASSTDEESERRKTPISKHISIQSCIVGCGT
jgi:hypothetical protein